MRITIIGLPGSGKSTLARMISEKLPIPHIHIDRFWFEAGGQNGSRDTPNIEQVRAHVKEKVMVAISGESWVSDGFYSHVQSEIADRADVIIYLNIALWRRLLNHAQRFLRRADRHKEVSMWNDLKFFSEIVRRTFTNGPKIQQFLAQYKNKLVVLRSRKEIKKYLAGLE